MSRIYKLILLVVLTIMVITACGRKDKEVNNIDQGISVDLYFINQDRTSLVIEKDTIESSHNQRIVIERLIERLEQGPKEKNLLRSIPEQLKVQEVKVDNKTIRIIFDETYYTLSSIEDVFVRSSVVKTLTQLEYVEFVEFFIKDQPLKGNNDKPVGLMKSTDFVENLNSKSEDMKEITLTLYFVNEEGTGLKAEQVKTTYDSNTSIEKKIIEMLIEGPTTEGLSPTIPKEAKLKQVYVKDGIGYIDFNEEFRSKHWGGSFGELMTIYSIVNSLAELPHINRVQFLINGQKQKEFQGHVQFDVLFERNLDLVEKQ